jgi:16S rRNA (cytosine1402-N4)-methyltransferase
MEHISVLLPESLDLLGIEDGKTYVDLTLGRAGTSSEILKKIPHGRLISFDQDEEAIAESREKLSAIGSNFTIIHKNFRYFVEELAQLGITKIDGLTADLGVSSPQFDEASRGFSYREDAPLDMRMDQSQPLTAEKIVNTYEEHELIRIFREYGEDPDSVRVARAICLARAKNPIVTTGQLVDIIKEAKPKESLLKKGHPAKQIFQAIRIETNDELGALREMLEGLEQIMAPLGRVAIISFHSLEDRLVKETFRRLTVVEGSRHGPDLLPSEIPAAPFLSLTRKPIEPTEQEKNSNHRASSAKLRGIMKKGETVLCKTN